MATDDPNERERIDQEIRINELKHEAEELAGGQMFAHESDDCPADLAEAFWQRVVDYEKAPLTCHFQQLTDAGVKLPDPETLTDAEVTAKLWEVIQRLARMRVFISRTDHLSDRELYAHLWSDSLRELNPDMPFDEYSAWHIDILGGCSEADIDLQMKYYEDEKGRRDWLIQFPDYDMPPHEAPPYDRDRHLPQSQW
jgi:hypothetical protein